MQTETRSGEAGAVDPPPKLIGGRYEVLGLMGRGGMGAVYRVRDRHGDREYALKQLTRGGSQADQARALFEREFRTLSQLRHPRIIEVYDYGLDERWPFFTMELLEGADMRDVSPLPWPTACRYLREVATSLALLHVRRLVHRDVTPRNVRMTPDGHCKLFDFGALIDAGQSGSVIGTPPCIPPEALDGQPVDARLDLYALGCLGYYMLTGRHAHPATDTRQLRTYWAREVPPPSAAKPEARADGTPLPAIPPQLDALITSLMQLDPMARPSSAGAVIDRLDVLLGERGGDNLDLASSYLGSAPLTGREPQMNRLQQALTQTMRGRGVCVMLATAPGMGRTRLLFEIATAAKLRGVHAARVSAEEHPRPYGTVQALASQLFSLSPDAARAAARPHAGVLGHFLPELMGERVSLAPKPDDVMLWRSMCQEAFKDFFLEVARAHTTALLIDDVHRADEPSAVLIAGLAHEAKHNALLLVCTLREGDAVVSDAATAALTHVAQPLRCTGLSMRNLQRWLESVFGDAPNVQRLATFLHERTEGQPALVMELLRFLIERGVLRYQEGTWVLPSEITEVSLPERIEQTFVQRLLRLDAATRALAEALSMHREALSLALCKALDERATLEEELLERLDALCRAGVLVHGPEGYRFANQRLRELLFAAIDGERRAVLHRRLAEAILAREGATPGERLSAGLYLLEANDPRGRPLVVEATLAVLSTHAELGSSVRLLEAALRLFHERGSTNTQRLVLLSALGLAAYAVDRRLDRHEQELLRTFDEVSGMDRARRWMRRMGKLGSLLGLLVGMVLFWLRPKNERPCGFVELTSLAVTGAVALAGKATVCLDGVSAKRIADTIEPLSALGRRQPGGYAHAYCYGLYLVTQDRYARTYEYFLHLERLLQEPGSLPGVPAHSKRLFEGGVNYVLGVFEALRSDKNVLERADALERSGHAVHELVAEQLRLQYYGFRGQAEEVRKAYESIEACAIQNGFSWQVETWSAIAINLYGTLWQDLIIAKRALDETARMAHEIPSLARYAVTSDATYQLLRGKARDCVQLYKSVLEKESPLSRIGWSVSCGLLATAHNQNGDHQQARELCELVLSTVEPADAAYCGMRISIELPYAVALAELGERERARALLLELVARYAATHNPLILGSIHETAARIAFAGGDRKTFTAHLKEVESCFTKLGNPALIARFQRLSDIAGEGGGMGAKVAIMREVKAFEAAVGAISELELGARHMLAWIMDKCEGLEGYLLTHAEEEPRLVAATSPKEPPQEVFDTVSEALKSFGTEADTTAAGTQVATQTGRDGSASHLYLLSYLDGERYCAEGALVLLGRASLGTPPVRFELLNAAAKQLRRLRGAA